MSIDINHEIPFTDKTRRAMLDRYAEIRQNIRAIQFSMAEEEGARDPAYVFNEMKCLSDTLSEIMDQYLRGVPKVPLSRCPLTGAMVIHSLDLFGIDGPWWDSKYPARPVEDLPQTFIDVKGAMHLNEPIEETPFVVRPGPDVPFVIPSVLQQVGVIAVLSSVKVGNHDGYVTCYFSEEKGSVSLVGNPWGMAVHSRTDEGDNQFGWVEVDIPSNLMDFDLEKWIVTGKLQWISPLDPMLLLHTGVEDCPYICLEGVRKNQVIYNGVRVFQ